MEQCIAAFGEDVHSLEEDERQLRDRFIEIHTEIVRMNFNQPVALLGNP